MCGCQHKALVAAINKNVSDDDWGDGDNDVIERAASNNGGREDDADFDPSDDADDSGTWGDYDGDDDTDDDSQDDFGDPDEIDDE